MIRFSLVCGARHDFESWFDSGESFEAQRRRRLIACPVCNSLDVSKAMMAPAVRGMRSEEPSAPSLSTEPTLPVTPLDEGRRKLRLLARHLRSEIEKNSVDVGGEFPKIARAIHEGYAPERSIRGRASVEEAQALVDDGIAVLPIPTLPDDFN